MSFQDVQNGGGGKGKKASASQSQAVAAGIFQINTAVATFRRLVDAIGTVKDTPDHRQKLSVTLSLSNLEFFLCVFLLSLASENSN